MPDPLDPTDAFFAAVKEGFARFGGAVAVSLGGHVLGSQAHGLATALATLPRGGWNSLPAALETDAGVLFMSWLGTFIGSFAMPRAWVFLPLDAWLLARLRTAPDPFHCLLALAVVQPVHTFVVRERFAPLSGMTLAAAVGLLAGCVAVTAGLVLWWRFVAEHAPEPHAETGEMEL